MRARYAQVVRIRYAPNGKERSRWIKDLQTMQMGESEYLHRLDHGAVNNLTRGLEGERPLEPGVRANSRGRRWPYRCGGSTTTRL